MSCTFTVPVSGGDRSVQVCVYNSARAMQLAATKESGECFVDAMAVSQPREKYRVGRNGEIYRKRNSGTIRFIKGQMSAEVVTHEATHMALALWRWDHEDDPTTLEMEHEERFCYLLGDLVGSIVGGLYKKDLMQS